MSVIELRTLAYEFAKKLDIKHVPDSWNNNGMAGKSWYYGFMSRQRRLSLRTPEQTSLNRIKAFCRENVKDFFKNLDDVSSIEMPISAPYDVAVYVIIIKVVTSSFEFLFLFCFLFLIYSYAMQIIKCLFWLTPRHLLTEFSLQKYNEINEQENNAQNERENYTQTKKR